MKASSTALRAMVDDQVTDVHISKGEDYLLEVLEMLKEKVSFAGEILPLGQYFFELPEGYDEKVQRKKWKGEVPGYINDYVIGLVNENKDTAAEMEDYLEAYANEKGIGKGMLMQPLRWVVSGQAGGPPIFEVLALIGLAEIAKRLEVVNEKFQQQTGMK